jgi:L-serine/L-threonine ammonia-lyase
MANGPRQETHFYASSGGNAGLACVVAARSLGHKATVVVPRSTTPMMIAKIKAAGASQVIQHGANFGEADSHLRNVVLPADKAGVYVPPFDHPVG